MSYIRKQWDEYRTMVVPDDAVPDQMSQLEQAFFAGALSLYVTIMKNLGPGPEPTDADMQRMEDLQTELLEYGTQIEARGFGGFKQ